MKLLVIDGDQLLSTMLTALLTRGLHTACAATSCKEAARLWKHHQPRLVIVDPALPDGDGLALCAKLQAVCPALVLAMSECPSSHDEVAFLRSGADAYLRKPFLPAQLMAQIEALSRRSIALVDAAFTLTPVVTVGPISVDMGRQVATCGDHTIPLTPIQCRLLRVLLENHKQIVTHELILDHVWGPEYGEYDVLLIKAHIRELRKKLGAECIATVRGIGYQFVLPEQ